MGKPSVWFFLIFTNFFFFKANPLFLLKYDLERNRMQMEIDNEPTSPPKPMNIDKWSISSQESKFHY